MKPIEAYSPSDSDLRKLWTGMERRSGLSRTALAGLVLIAAAEPLDWPAIGKRIALSAMVASMVALACTVGLVATV